MAQLSETPKSLDPFHQLVQDLRDVLGPSSGIDSADVDPMDLQSLMRGYRSSPSEWDLYAFGDATRSYTRNLVDSGNGRSNLLILVWSPGKGSPIHDHANSHCIMKVLKGRLKETIYNWPDQSLLQTDVAAPPVVKAETLFEENEVTYIADTIGLHKVENPDPNNFAVSLHLYTPPNAARYGCQIFNEKTGAAVHVKQCQFFSELGQKL